MEIIDEYGSWFRKELKFSKSFKMNFVGNLREIQTPQDVVHLSDIIYERHLFLTTQTTTEEIIQMVRQICRLKAPGPECMHAIFY